MSQFLRNTLNFSLDDTELEEETQRILSNGKIQLQQWEINKLIGEINGELDYKDLMPSRKYDFFWMGATLSLIVIMIIFILYHFDSIYWKIGLPLIALVVACFGFLIGLYVKKKQDLVTIEKLVIYVFHKLSHWTLHKLHNTNDLNLQRILIENYFNCFFMYRQSLRLPTWDEALHIQYIKEILNNQKYEKALKLSLKLFEILFKDKNENYKKQGAFILIKVFISIKYYCDRTSLSKYVEQLEKDFYLQTGVNPTEKPIIQLMPFPQKVEVVNKNYFKFSVPFFQYFENIWENGYNDIEEGQYIVQDICKNCDNKFCVCETQNKTLLYVSQKLKPQALQSSKQESQSIVESFIKKHSHKVMSDKQENNNSQNQSFQKTLMGVEKMGLEINEIQQEQEEILPAVQKLLTIEEEPDSNYKIIQDKPSIRIMKKTEEGNPVILVRSFLIVDGTIDDIHTLLTNLELRMQWDVVFSQMKVLKIFNKNCDVVYSYIKAPVFVTDRDFLQKRQLLKNYKNVDYIIAFENYEDNQFPEKKGVIRADSIISGYLIRKKNEKQSYLTIISQNDIKGYIPKSIVNAQVAKAPLAWMKKFNKALENYKSGKL